MTTTTTATTAGSPEDRLMELLKELHLPGVRHCYSEEGDQARKESSSYEAYLLQVLEREQETRRANRIERFLRDSKLPPYVPI